jgi:hypothetical protein
MVVQKRVIFSEWKKQKEVRRCHPSLLADLGTDYRENLKYDL